MTINAIVNGKFGSDEVFELKKFIEDIRDLVN